MTIRKQEFYEGAALHRLSSSVSVIFRYASPFFILNDRLWVLLKYCTKGRSPWNFTFTAQEQAQLQTQASACSVVLGLICGDDGIAAIDIDSYFGVAALSGSAVHVACFRGHGEYYEISGPDGVMAKKVSPSRWECILSQEDGK